MNMSIGSAGIEMIKTFEGFRANAYRDPIGIVTIGYGSTGKLSDGTPVVMGLTITKEKAAAEINVLCARRYGAGINKQITRDLKQNEFDALCSMAWNRGSLRSDLVTAVNNNNREGIYNAFMAITTAGGKTLQGLVRRRKAELNLYFEGSSMPVSNNYNYSSSENSNNVSNEGYINGAGTGKNYQQFFTDLNNNVNTTSDVSVNDPNLNTTSGVANMPSSPIEEIKKNQTEDNACS